MSLILIILSNLYPALMCYRGEWIKTELLALFWFETWLHYGFSTLKLICAARYRAANFTGPASSEDSPSGDTNAIIGFSIASAIIIAISAFLFSLLNIDSGTILFGHYQEYVYPVRYGLLALFVSYFYSFWYDFIANGKYKKSKPNSLDMIGGPIMKTLVQIIAVYGAFVLAGDVFEKENAARMFYLFVAIKVFTEAILYVVEAAHSSQQES